MDLTLVALMALIVVTTIVKTRSDARWRSGAGHAYQRVFSAAAMGLLLAGVGLAGGDLRHSHGLFRGVRWSESPVWWQVAVGAVLLVVAASWARSIIRQPSR